MKLKLISLVVSLFLGSIAFANNLTIKHVEFNPTRNSYNVEFDGAPPQEFAAKDLVVKLDGQVRKPSLTKGQHLYYLNFPSFRVMSSLTTDISN